MVGLLNSTNCVKITAQDTTNFHFTGDFFQKTKNIALQIENQHSKIQSLNLRL
jgi:hypothetical protein